MVLFYLLSKTFK